MAWLGAYLPAEQAIAADDRLDQLAAALRNSEDPRTFAARGVAGARRQAS